MYLIAALQQVQADIAVKEQAALYGDQSVLVDAILTAVLNDVSASPKDFLVVLDDYHVINEKTVHDSVEFMLEHAPVQLHLVILSRTDPPLPLSRFRVRRHMIELRAADFRFTGEEAWAFFDDLMNLGLEDEDVAVLETRTEGWVAGMQMAALSLNGREDKSEFVASFAGSHRYVID